MYLLWFSIIGATSQRNEQSRVITLRKKQQRLEKGLLLISKRSVYPFDRVRNLESVVLLCGFFFLNDVTEIQVFIRIIVQMQYLFCYRNIAAF